jgi:protein kinase C substrate 80K-H
VYKFEEYLPKPVRDWVDQKLRDFRVMLIENGILASPSESGESKAVAEARSRLDSAKGELTAQKLELDTHEGDLTKDFGPDDVFRALKDKCVESDSGEYTYEVCYMSRTTQKSKKGGAHTGMGNFARFETIVVDEDLPADGRGLGSGERLVMKYENGQHCWNGPSRSTTVILACAEKDEIWKIAEEEKCVYRMEVGTPAACNMLGQPAPAHSRDEL